MPVRGPSIGQGGPKFMDPWWSKHFRGGPYIMDPLGPYITLYLDWGSKYNVIVSHKKWTPLNWPPQSIRYGPRSEYSGLGGPIVIKLTKINGPIIIANNND